MCALIKVLASGSGGNCYILTAGADRLIIEAGVPDKVLLAALDYNLDGVCGVIVTHRHGDHAKYIPQYGRYFDVHGNFDVCGYYPTAKELQAAKRYKIGGFSVMPLNVEHGVPNFAYVIDHPETGRIVFATDCVSFPYVIKDCAHLLIECNYVEDLVVRGMLDGDDTRSQIESHMELSETIATVERLKNPLLRSVTLIHASSSNFDRDTALRRFKAELDITPLIAIKNIDVNVSRFEF